MSRLALVVLALSNLAAVADTNVRRTIDLNGTWQFRLDPDSLGEREHWFSEGTRFSESIQVPGCWQAQGFGKPSGILRNDYSGPAWYRRTAPIPAPWNGKRVTMRIGGALRITELFVNGVHVGSHDGLSAPFEFDVTRVIHPGSSNMFAIKVTNPGMRPGDSPDKQAGNQPTGGINYIGNWGGIYGPVVLEATGPVSVDQMRVRSDVAKHIASFQVTVHNAADQPFRGSVRAVVGPHTKAVAVVLEPGQSFETEIALPIANARLWSPEDPYLYTAAISILCGKAECDHFEQRFGMREITTRGSVLLLNGKPLYLRGYGDDNVEVISGVPPASKEVYLKRLRLVRSFGFNSVRFHSMTPVSQYFDAADEAGLLVLSELPVVYTQYLLPNKEFLREELKSIVLAHRNHPSWLSLAMGNEFNLNWIKDESRKREFLDTVREFYDLAKSLMPDRIVMSNDGYAMEPTDLVSMGRGASEQHPTIRHEFGGYYCSLPDVALIPEFSGVMTPVWLAVKQRWVEENGLMAQYPAYVRNSQRLVHLGHKFQIEAARMDPKVTGYEYWLGTDYPGGTGEGDSWEEGWFDFFWRPKGITPEQGRQINSAVLPLVDAAPAQRTFWAEEPKRVAVSVSNYGGRDLSGDVGSWRLTSAGSIITKGSFIGASAPAGTISTIGHVDFPPVGGDKAGKIDMTVDVDGHGNSWQFWSFPKRALLREAKSKVVATAGWPGLHVFYPFIGAGAEPSSTSDLWITATRNDTILRFLQSGGRVWLALNKESKLSFFPASGGALGTVIEQHPALNGFPHEGLADLQFYSLMEHASPFELDSLRNVRPIMGAIRTRSSFLSKSKDLSRVGYVFEARVGAGRLLVTTLRIGDLLDANHPEVVYLFDRLLRYCLSDAFQPAQEIAPELLRNAVMAYFGDPPRT